jgi:hypothetical protein
VDKKPLIVASLCVVVLLILGSLTNVVGYQIDENLNQKIIGEYCKTSAPAKTNELKLVNMWIDWDMYNDYLFISIQNNGTKTIHSIHVYAEWNNVFLNHHTIYRKSFSKSTTLEPQGIYNFLAFNIPLNFWVQTFLRIFIHIMVIDPYPFYDTLHIEDKYCIDVYKIIRPMSGIPLWLANILGL